MRPLLVSMLLAAVSLAGCTYDRGEGPPGTHFAEFRVAPPAGNAVEVCHAYTCQIKTTFYFRSNDIQDISTEMRKVKNGDTPFQERRAIAYAIAMIEKKVGARTRHQGQGWHGIRWHRRSDATGLRR